MRRLAAAGDRAGRARRLRPPAPIGLRTPARPCARRPQTRALAATAPRGRGRGRDRGRARRGPTVDAPPSSAATANWPCSPRLWERVGGGGRRGRRADRRRGRDRQDAAGRRAARPRPRRGRARRAAARRSISAGAPPFAPVGRAARRAARELEPPPADADWPEELGRLAPSLPRRLGRARGAPADVPPDLARARLFEAAVELAEHATADRPLVLAVRRRPPRRRADARARRLPRPPHPATARAARAHAAPDAAPRRGRRARARRARPWRAVRELELAPLAARALEALVGAVSALDARARARDRCRRRQPAARARVARAAARGRPRAARDRCARGAAGDRAPRRAARRITELAAVAGRALDRPSSPLSPTPRPCSRDGLAASSGAPTAASASATTCCARPVAPTSPTPAVTTPRDARRAPRAPARPRPRATSGSQAATTSPRAPGRGRRRRRTGHRVVEAVAFLSEAVELRPDDAPTTVELATARPARPPRRPDGRARRRLDLLAPATPRARVHAHHAALWFRSPLCDPDARAHAPSAD